jgi:2-C-methyl-D-erythritol 4-phosphate cytidylyltransferase
VEVWAIVLAAGGGTRFGGHKQFAVLGSERLVDRSVRTASSVCDGVVLVLPPGEQWDGAPVRSAVTGGTTRQGSVRCGLASVPLSVGVIAIHDAAHPLATEALLRAVIAAVREGAEGAVPAVSVTETIKRVRGRQVLETVLRDGLVITQMPHAFAADVLRAAHSGVGEASDDSVLVERIGGTITVVPGELFNLHITNHVELELAGRLLVGS